MINQNFTRKVWRLFLIIAAVTWFGWLTWQDIAPSDEFKTRYDFTDDSPFIKRLWPPFRLSELMIVNADGQQIILGDPVHLDVLPPRLFQTAVLTVFFKNPANNDWRAGLLHQSEPWQVELKPFELSAMELRLGDWQKGEATFDLTKLPNQERLKFLLSAPGIEDQENGITVTAVEVTLLKEPITWDNAFTKTVDYFIAKFY